MSHILCNISLIDCNYYSAQSKSYYQIIDKVNHLAGQAPSLERYSSDTIVLALNVKKNAEFYSYTVLYL